MASVPNLYVGSPQIQSPISQYGQVLSLRNLLQQQQLQQGQQQLQRGQIQMQQMQLQDAQNMRALAPKFITRDSSGNVTGYNTDGYFNALAQSGVNPGTIAQLRNQYATATKNIADAGAAQLKLQTDKNSQAYQILEGVRSVASDKTVDPQATERAYQAALPKLQQLGVDTSKYPQSFQQVGLTGLNEFESGLGVHAQMLADAKTVQDTQQSAAKTAESQANTQKTQLETNLMQQYGFANPSQMESKYINVLEAKRLGQPVSPTDAAFAKSYEHMKTLVPQFNLNMQGANQQFGATDPTVQAVANGSMPIQSVLSPRTPLPARLRFLAAVQEANPNFNAANFDIQKGVLKDFTSGASAKNLTAFNTAIDHANLALQAVDALGNGDVRALNSVSNKLGYEFGQNATTNYNVIKSALSGEISKVFKGGQATDAEIKEVQQPFDNANSPAQLKGAIQTAIRLMGSKRDALQQQYQSGIQGRPNFGASASAGSRPPLSSFEH